MPETNHVIICSATTVELQRQAEVLRRVGLCPFGEPWALGELWCWTWLGPLSRPMVDPNEDGVRVVREGSW